MLLHEYQNFAANSLNFCIVHLVILAFRSFFFMTMQSHAPNSSKTGENGTGMFQNQTLSFVLLCNSSCSSLEHVYCAYATEINIFLLKRHSHSNYKLFISMKIIYVVRLRSLHSVINVLYDFFFRAMRMAKSLHVNERCFAVYFLCFCCCGEPEELGFYYINLCVK